MPDDIFDPGMRVADSNPGAPLLEEFRKFCRGKVREIGSVWIKQFPKLAEADRYPAICVPEVLTQLNAYGTVPSSEALTNEPAAKTERDSDLMRKFYDGDVGAFEVLYKRKLSFKNTIGRRYPGFDADIVYDKTFMYIYETAEMKHPPYDFKNRFDAWFWWIANNKTIEELLHDRTPVAVLRTPYFRDECAAELPDSLWMIRLADDVVKLEVPSRSLKELQTAIRTLQSGKRRTRWKWTFDVVSYEEAGMGICLVFRIYSYDEIDVASVSNRSARLRRRQEIGKSLLFPVATTGMQQRGAKPAGMLIDDAEALCEELRRKVMATCEAIRECKPDEMTAIYLCDIRGIALKDAVYEILHAGQPDGNKVPPFGAVGRWRSVGKQALAKRIPVTESALDELLHYLNYCFYDPHLGEDAI
jgi:hypothetical protein